MRIRSTVKLATLVIISVVLIYSAFAVLIDHTIEARYQDLRQASYVRTIFNQLRSLTTDYFLYQTERAHQQWWMVHNSFQETLRATKWQTFQKKYAFEDFADHWQVMGEDFGKLMAVIEKSGLSPSEVEANKELQNRLITQIMVNAREIDTSLNRIFEGISGEVVALQHHGSLLSFIALFILIAFITAHFAFLSRSVVQPVLKLHEGAEIIGRGNLDFRVEPAGPGEIRELCQGFNQMTASLSKLTHTLRKSQEDLRYLASELINAQEKERQYIGLELHDDLGQLLIILKMQLRAMQRNLPAEAAPVKDELEKTLSFVNEIVERIRRLSRSLRPTVLEDMGLCTGLKLLFEDFQKYHGLKLSVEMDDIETVFPWDNQILIYRIFQESLTNVAKHAGATEVSITIKHRDQAVDFQMKDNGCGFDLKKILEKSTASRGLGLAAVDERVRMLGGDLQFWSRPGQGTRLSFTVPITSSSG